MSHARTIIVGDIHGCMRELERLLVKVNYTARDRLISVGDLVGKGPHGDEVVRFFRKGGHEAVRGNHDDKLLRWWYARKCGDVLPQLRAWHAITAHALKRKDWEWLDALPYFLRLAPLEVLVVHAGLVPGTRLEEQRIVDLMNLRSIRADGTGSKRFEDGQPWAKCWEGPEEVVFGHDALRGLQCWPHATGIDTGCCYGRELTAYVLPERYMVSVRAEAAYAFNFQP